LATLVACVPWTWRNYITFHSFFFMRNNLGLESRIGNHEGAATFEEMDANPYAHCHHPRLFPTEVAKLRAMGEVEYIRLAGEDALDGIRAHPGEFPSLTLLRFANLWGGPLHSPRAAAGVTLLTLSAMCGRWLNRRTLTMPQRAVFIIPLATYPVIYYVVAYGPRYRVPIDWILFILAGALLWRAIGGFRATSSVGAKTNRSQPADNSLERTRPEGGLMYDVDWLRRSARSR
jgi:hypothetical protein